MPTSIMYASNFIYQMNKTDSNSFQFYVIPTNLRNFSKNYSAFFIIIICKSEWIYHRFADFKWNNKQQLTPFHPIVQSRLFGISCSAIHIGTSLTNCIESDRVDSGQIFIRSIRFIINKNYFWQKQNESLVNFSKPNIT